MRPHPSVFAFRELIREHVRDQDERILLAYRTFLLRAFAAETGGTEQVGMRIAYLETRQAARLEGAQCRPSSKRIVDARICCEIATARLPQSADIVHDPKTGGKGARAQFDVGMKGLLIDISIRYIGVSSTRPHMKKTSSLELAVLGLLKEGPMHGYELSKRLRFTLGPLYTVSYGSLYPCLKRLGIAGMVQEELGPAKTRRRKSVAEPRTNRAVIRRARKVYVITPEGERFFFEQLEQGAVYDTDRFQTRFAFFRYLPKDMRIRLLEHRKAYLEEKLAEFNETLRATRERMDNYSRSLIDHGVETTQQDIKWLEGLIDQERAAGTVRAEPVTKTEGRATRGGK